MKVLTVNFITCAVKACKASASSFPLHFQDVEVEQQEVHFEPTFIQNLLSRIDWTGLRTTAIEVVTPGRGGFLFACGSGLKALLLSSSGFRRFLMQNRIMTPSTNRCLGISIVCFSRHRSWKGSWCAGTVATSTVLRKALRTFCFRII